MDNPDHCSVGGCQRLRYGKQDVCEPHYRRRRRTGSLDEARPIGVTTAAECMVDGCGNISAERGLCHGHYLRLVRIGDVQADVPLGRQRNAECTVDGCNRLARGRGLCGPHLARVRSKNDVMAHVPIKEVTGAGYLHHSYRVVPVPQSDRWLVGGKTSELEHRYVMAKMLGRALTADESVHHRSGDKLDNRPANLELWARWQPSGQRVADKLRAALDLVDKYAPELLVRPPGPQSDSL